MKCFDYAMKYIYHYPKTEKELKAKLLQKGFSSDDVNKTLEILKSKWFLDDMMFAESYIRSEIVKKGKPTLVIVKKLEMKWVARPTIKAALDKYTEDMAEGIHDKIKKDIQAYKRKWIEWFDIIQKLIRKWYKLDDIKDVITNK